MSKLAEYQALAEQEALESGFDMNEAQKGGGGGRLLPKGWAFAQLVEYIELGHQPQEFNGKAKDPALEFTLGFALSGHAPNPDKPGEMLSYSNDDGTPYVLRPYSMAMSRNEKARAFLLFKAMNWKGTAKNFAQLLGQKFLVEIVHEPKSKADQKLVSRINLKNIMPPLVTVGPQAGQPYPIADAPDEMYRMFLFERPTKAAWDSLYIEGQYEAKDGKPAQSKNRIQETILGALNFQGSPLQLLLAGLGIATPAPQTAQAAPAGVVAPQVTQPAAVAVAAPPVASPVVPPQATVAVPSVPVASPAQSPVTVSVPQAVAAPVVAIPTAPSVASPVLPA